MSCEIKHIVTDVAAMDCAIIKGGRRPILMIPGMSLHKVTPQADVVAFAYKMLLEDHSIFLLDRRDDPAPCCSIGDMAGDAAAALAHLGIEGACIIGPSQGGMIAMSMALAYPDCVKALFLSSTLVRQNSTSKETMRVWKELSTLDSPVALNRDVFRRVYSPSYYNRYERAFVRLEGLGTSEEMRSFGIMADAAAAFDVYDRLGGISCPVYVTGVQQDLVLGSEGTADIISVLGCGCYVYSGSGHAAYDEDPDFPKKLKNFLDSLTI